MDEQIIEDFHDSLDETQQAHAGHDVVVDENTVSFFPDEDSASWRASHEAWLFKDWLEDNGYTVTWIRNRHGYKDPKTVAVVEDVDMPDWIDVKPNGREHIVLFAMDERVRVHRDELDEGVERLRNELWRSLQSVSGVGKSTVEKIAAQFETPIDAHGSFEDVDGVGSTMAQKLDSYVEVWT